MHDIIGAMLLHLAAINAHQAEIARETAELTRLIAERAGQRSAPLANRKGESTAGGQAVAVPVVVPQYGSNIERTLVVFHQRPSEVFRRVELIELLGQHGLNKNMVSGALDALKKQGLIERAGRGAYRLTAKGRPFKLRGDR